MTPRPVIENAPGLSWRWLPREGWEARWRAQPAAIKAKFPIKSQRIWTGLAPDEQQRALIADRCNGLHSEMLIHLRGGIPAGVFDGLLRGVVQAYKTDEFSNYHKLRYETRRSYDKHLNQVMLDYGDTALAEMKARSFLGMHAAWARDNGPASARFRIQILRAVFTYGLRLLDDERGQEQCDRLSHTLSKLEFPTLAPRTEVLTAAQANAIRASAKYRSIALAQAIQFDCSFRQKDVIGEWVPVSEKEMSDVITGGKKWVRGIRWEQIDANFQLVHRNSKRNKVIAIPLLLCPMVVEELARVDAKLRRERFPKSGPVVVCEYYGVPWQAIEYRRIWRKTARAC